MEKRRWWAALVATLVVGAALSCSQAVAQSPNSYSYGYDHLSTFTDHMIENRIWDSQTWPQAERAAGIRGSPEPLPRDGRKSGTTSAPGLTRTQLIALVHTDSALGGGGVDAFASGAPTDQRQAFRAAAEQVIALANRTSDAVGLGRDNGAVAAATFLCYSWAVARDQSCTNLNWAATAASMVVPLARSRDYQSKSPRTRRTLFEQQIILGMLLGATMERPEVRANPALTRQWRALATRVFQESAGAPPTDFMITPNGLVHVGR